MTPQSSLEKLAPEPLSPFARMMISSGGLIFFFIAYGVFQERIMTIGYGPDEEIFTYSAFLVLNNRIFVCLVSLGMVLRGVLEVFHSVYPLVCVLISHHQSLFCFSWPE
mmetsp:Transcript_12979/g.33127  ORF Transcript_12979/g.33127 Transcript_12979/m.33127 type:complete len:109 (-) Transcript_12979:1342-1668(-)